MQYSRILVLNLLCLGAADQAHAGPVVVAKKMEGGFDSDARHHYADDVRVYTAAPGGTGYHKLLVFLHGTGGKDNPDTGVGHMNFLNTASALGYYVVSLDYFSSDATPRSRCGCDPECYTWLRRRQLDGGNVPEQAPEALQQAKVHESVEARLHTVLAWLKKYHAGEGWGQFIANGAPKWSSIVMSGHSQGSGLAAFTAKYRSLAGVILFAGPMDSTNESGAINEELRGCEEGKQRKDSVPSWIADNHFGHNEGTRWATDDINKYWGIRGTRDTNTTNADCTSAVKRNWDAMALNTAHNAGVDDGYGSIDTFGQGPDDYVSKGRRGLFIGLDNAKFTQCAKGKDAKDRKFGTPSVSPVVTSPIAETCLAEHTSMIAGDKPGECSTGGTYHNTFPKLSAAWVRILTSL